MLLPIIKTPIKIIFTNPIETANTITNTFEDYKLVISVDASNLYVPEQFLPQQYVINVPSNGIVLLKLIPSTASKPNFRYRVKYYGNNKLLDEQYWLVPCIKEKTSLTIEIVNGSYILPVSIYEILSVSPQIEYTVTNSVLYISTDGTYSIEYIPAVTLSDIVLTNE